MKKTMAINSEEIATYEVAPQTQTEADNDTISRAIGILFNRMVTKGAAMNSPKVVRDYFQLRLATLEHEVFCCLFLDAQNSIISCEDMFRGTLSQASVYPREVVKAALALNASGVIFAHNHPSGHCEPSHADELLTGALKQALALVDVRTLDHIIVAGRDTLSFAERGLI